MAEEQVETLSEEQAENFLTAPIDDYLLALADSIHQAQIQLSRMRVPAQPGQPAITYQLPRVDFELKMSFEVSRTTSEEGKTGLVLRAKPISQTQASTQSTTAEAASVIKGSFVAVPSDGGKPPSIIRTSLFQTAERNLEVTVTVRSAAGENLAGLDVEFNVDREKSKTFNRFELMQEIELSRNTVFLDGKVTTNASGQATSTLLVDHDEPFVDWPSNLPLPPFYYIVAIVDVAGDIETIVYKSEMPIELDQETTEEAEEVADDEEAEESNSNNGTE